MYQTIQQTYRHIIQQHIVQREMSLGRKTHQQGTTWEIYGILALFSAATACGALAQVHLG